MPPTCLLGVLCCHFHRPLPFRPPPPRSTLQVPISVSVPFFLQLTHPAPSPSARLQPASAVPRGFPCWVPLRLLWHPQAFYIGLQQATFRGQLLHHYLCILLPDQMLQSLLHHPFKKLNNHHCLNSVQVCPQARFTLHMQSHSSVPLDPIVPTTLFFLVCDPFYLCPPWSSQPQAEISSIPLSHSRFLGYPSG